MDASNPGGVPQYTWRIASPPVVQQDRVPTVQPVMGVGVPQVPVVPGFPGVPGSRRARPVLPWLSAGYGPWR